MKEPVRLYPKKEPKSIPIETIIFYALLMILFSLIIVSIMGVSYTNMALHPEMIV